MALIKSECCIRNWGYTNVFMLNLIQHQHGMLLQDCCSLCGSTWHPTGVHSLCLFCEPLPHVAEHCVHADQLPQPKKLKMKVLEDK